MSDLFDWNNYIRELADTVAGEKPRTRFEQLCDELETILDQESIYSMIEALGHICANKAEHIRANWQDNPLADQWEKWALALDRALSEL